METQPRLHGAIIAVVMAFTLLASCTNQPTATLQAAATPQPSATSTLPPPTATPVPLAASVNGEGILLEDYLAEILRLQDAQTALSIQSTLEEQQALVLAEMVNQVLLAQAAEKAGYSISDADFTTHLGDLIEKTGGNDPFQAWLTTNHYNADGFSRLLKTSLAATWQRDQIIQSVPLETEQVSVLQILVFDENLAQNIYQQLINGADFSVIAFQYEPDSGGWLGWFPRGYLLLKEIEEAAFSLQPGEYSDVITTQYGYHILYLKEKDPLKTLSASSLAQLQSTALKAWLEDTRAQSDIQIITP